MGFPMAINLRTGLGPDKKILICDVSEQALSKYQTKTEGKGPVEVVKNGFEAVQQAVSAVLE